MKKYKVLVAQLGARRHYQQPVLFHQLGILEVLYTDIYASNSILTNLLRSNNIYCYLPKVIRKFLERYDPLLEGANIIQFPKLGYEYQSLRKLYIDEIYRIFLWANQEFCSKIIKKGFGKANIIYGFNGASLELFEYAKNNNIRCVLDQTLAEMSLVDKLLLEEEERWKNWSINPWELNKYRDLMAERQTKEQELADCIVCGSNFVKDSLLAKGINKDKISVISIGRYPKSSKNKAQERSTSKVNKDRTLKILFAGTVELRKGIPYLLQALSLLKEDIPFSCKIAGSIAIKSEKINQYSDICQFLGRVPSSQMADLYRWADVFVFPSICEGSAMVIYEAMSFGLPVITTYNSGSIIRDSIDGYIVPIRNAEAIANKLKLLFSQPELLSTMGQAGMKNLLSDHYETQKNNLIKILKS